MEDKWGVAITHLQEVFKYADEADFESLDPKNMNFHNMTEGQLKEIQEQLEHRQIVNIKLQNFCNELMGNVSYVLENYPEEEEIKRESSQVEPDVVGKSYWTSALNPEQPIEVGSEVAYKSKKSGEWIQCICTKISADGMRFEVKDPEPDEFGKPGSVFKCNWKEIILIPSESTKKSQLPNYPVNTKVLARYPETTTFYPAIVSGSKRDGTCKLQFDGEEEIDKETEVERRLVLPFPSRR